PTITEAAIREVFEFVDGECDIVIAQLGQGLPAAPQEPAPVVASEPEISMLDLMALTEEEVAPEPSFTPDPEPEPVGVQDTSEDAPGLSFAALAEELKSTPPLAAPKPAPVETPVASAPAA